MIMRAMLYSEHIPGNLGFICRKEYTDLRDSTVQDFERYTGIKVDSNRNVKLKNKSQIMFRHLEELNNLQNINLGWFAIEQVDELETDNIFFTLHGRTRRDVEPDDYFKSLGLDLHPGFVIGNVGQPWVRRIWKESQDEKYQLVEANTFDNADVLPSDYISNLRALETKKPEIYKRFVMNEWDCEDNAFVLIPVKYIEELRGINIYDRLQGKVIACDPSTGGDECVIYVFYNSIVIDQMYLYERDTMKIVGHLMLLSAKHNINNFAVDTIGIGQGITDRLVELGKKVYAIKSSMSSSNDRLFYNLRSEMWWYVSQRIINKELPYPKDDELIRQLASIKYKVVNSNGQIKLEGKDETKKRLDRSPDRADTFVYGIWATQYFTPNVNLYRPKQYRNLAEVYG